MGCSGVGGCFLFFICLFFGIWVFEEVGDGTVVDQKMSNWELSLKGVLNSLWMQVGGSQRYKVLEVGSKTIMLKF